MLIVGCDFHPSWQQIVWLDSETGETGERKLVHASGETKQFYEQLPRPALIGMEAGCPTHSQLPSLPLRRGRTRTSGITGVADGSAAPFHANV
jgi:hypothetical protein